MVRRLAVVAGVVGIAAVLSASAFASTANHPPTITATKATFTIPAGGTSTWALRLWSNGTMEGAAHGTSGELTVAVPVTSSCKFQADVSVTPAGGKSTYYSGTIVTVPDCGPLATIAGHIYACSVTGTQTTTEIVNGTLAATGPQMVSSQANPLSPPVPVTSGSYTMTAGAPNGYVLTGCGGSATVSSNGASATETVAVPLHGNGVGIFYVVAVPAPHTSPSGSGSGPPGGSSGGNAPATPGSSSSSTVTHAATTAAATKAGSSELAFTGMNTGPLLFAGLALLGLGLGLFALAGIRGREPVVSPVRTTLRRRT
jgi:hypothetical protein